MRAWIPLGAGLLLAGCGPPAPPSDEVVAPLPRATVVLEPSTLLLGQVARLEVAVVTPPDHQVAPLVPPRAVPGIWVLDWEAPVLERRPERWLHRAGIRIRTQELGEFQWPALRIQVEGPEEVHTTLVTEPVALRVVTSQAESPPRQTPYPLRELPAPAGWRPLAGAAAGGALLALAAVAAVARWRRSGLVHTARHEASTQAADPVSAWREACADLDAACQRGAREPAQAAADTAVVLRRYVVCRFGLELGAHTTEELAAARTPRVLATRWQGLVEVLRELDRARFRAPEAVETDPRAERRARQAIDAAARFARETRPQEVHP